MGEKSKVIRCWARTLIRGVSSCLLLLPGLVFSQYATIYQALLEYPGEGLHAVTTHPGNDLAASISPDGQWIVFASDRSGNFDLWIKSVTGGLLRQLTTHRADDLDPHWAADGKKIVFVSRRRDAEGDLWILPLQLGSTPPRPKGKPYPVTTYLGYDGEPCFSPDGSSIAFTSDRSGQRNIWILKLQGHKIYPLTHAGGFSPSWSPDGKWIAFSSVRKGQKAGNIYIVPARIESSIPKNADLAIPVTKNSWIEGFPLWSRQGDALYFSRYCTDTDGDGKVTLRDNPILFKRNIQNLLQISEFKLLYQISSWDSLRSAQTEWQLTAGDFFDFMPCAEFDQKLYFISRRTGNFDIWRMPSLGSVPVFYSQPEDRYPGTSDQYQSNGARQLQYVHKQFPLDFITTFLDEGDTTFQTIWQQNREAFLRRRLLALRKVWEFFPDDTTSVLSALVEAIHTLKELKQKSAAEAICKRVILEYSNRCRLARLEQISLTTNNIAAQIDSLINLSLRYPEDDEFQAIVHYRLGRLYLQQGNFSRAISSLQLVVDQYSNEASGKWAAQAQIAIGDIYAMVGSSDEVIRAYLKVLDNYPMQRLLVRQAIYRILQFVAKSIFGEDPILSYQNIIQKYARYSELAGHAQLRIAACLIRQGDYRNAIHELERTIQKYGSQPEVVLRAQLLLAELHQQLDDVQAAIGIYRQICERQDLDSYQRKWIRQKLIATLIASADQLKHFLDFQVALSRYRQARQLDINSIEAHRGIIECAYRLGKLDEIILEYRNLVAQHPENENILYALGLAYSYKGENNIKVLQKSNQLIEKALTKNYRLVYGYLTLSYNYEALETLEKRKRQRPRSFLAKAWGGLFASLRWAFCAVTFRKSPTPQQWYEKAIDLLTTAIAINDEKENPKLESLLAFNVANDYYHLGEFGFTNAYRYYQLKLKYDSTFVSKNQEAIFYERIGHCGLIVEDWDNTISYLQRAVKLYRELGKQNNVLLNLQRLALAYQLSGDYEASAEVFQNVLSSQQYQKSALMVERIYRNLAYNYQMLGDDEEVLRYCEKAIEISYSGKIKEKKSKAGYFRLEFLGFSIPVLSLGVFGDLARAAKDFTLSDEKALLYSIVAKSYSGQKLYRQAIVALNKKLEIFRRQKNFLGETILLNNLGVLHVYLGEYAVAWDYFQQSLKLCRKRQMWGGAIINLVDIARLANICWLLNEQARVPQIDYQETLKLLQTGLDYFKQIPVGMKDQRVAIYHQLGLISFLANHPATNLSSKQYGLDSTQSAIAAQINSLEKLSQILLYLDHALELAKRFRLFRQQVLILKNLGEVYSAFQFWDEAKQNLLDSRDLALQKGYLDIVWRIDLSLWDLIRARTRFAKRKAFRLEDPEPWLQEALLVLENLTVSAQNESFDPAQSLDRDRLYHQMIRLRRQRKQVAEAIQLVEHYRSKRCIDLLRQKKIDLKREIHKLSWGNLVYLAKEIDRLSQAIREIESGSTQSYDHLQKLQDSLKVLQKDYQQQIAELKKQEPQLLALVLPYSVSLNEFQQLLKDNQVVLDYFVESDSTVLWTITSDSVFQIVLPLTKGWLTQEVKRYRLQVMNAAPDSGLARTLSRQLLLPVWSILQKKREWIIVSDAPLSSLPFSTLPIPSGLNRFETKPVMEDFAVFLTPSLMDYYFCYQNRRLRGHQALIVGELGTNSLPDTLVTVLPKNQATEKNFRQMVTEADIIQLDQPLFYQTYRPLHSMFQFAYPSQRLHSTKQQEVAKIILPFSSDDDGYLHFYEIFGLNLQANLLMLKSPVFPDNVAQSDETFSLLCKSWVYAGVPAMVTLRWKVKSEVWNRFLTAMYENLFNTQSRSSEAWQVRIFDAFRRAIAALRKQAYPISQWGAFQWIGFPGMGAIEEKIFAETEFVRTVLHAQQFEQKGYWKDAIYFYETAVRMANLLNDVKSLENLYQAIVIASSKGQLYKKAIFYQKKLNLIYQKAQRWESLANGYNTLFYLYSFQKDSRSALENKRRYIQLLEAHGMRADQAASLREMGIVLENNAQYIEALQQYNQSLKIYQRLKNDHQQAILLMDIARIYLTRLDQYGKAIELCNQAYPTFEELGDTLNQIICLQNLGLAYEKLASYFLALKYQKQAMNLAKNLTEDKIVGLNHQYLANLYWKMGDYLNALAEQRQAIEYFEKLQNSKLLDLAYSTMGLIRLSLGEADVALKLERQALNFALQANDQLDQATILKNIGLIYFQQTDWDSTIANYRRAAFLDSLTNSRRGLAYDFRNLGNSYLQIGQHKKAYNLLQKALDLSQQIHDGRNEAATWLTLGIWAQKTGQEDSAIDFFGKAITLSDRFLIPDLNWRALFEMGKIFQARGDLKKALEYFKKAIDVIEQMRAKIKVEEYKTGFLGGKLAVYDQIIELLLTHQEQWAKQGIGTGPGADEQSLVGQAFNFVERAKSRSFIDLLGNKQINFGKDVPPELLQQGEKIRQQINRLEVEIRTWLQKTETLTRQQQRTLDSLRTKLQSWRHKYSDYLVVLQEKNPQLASMVSVNPLTWQEIQSLLPDGFAMLAYYITAKCFYIWFIDNQQILVHRKEIHQAELERLVRQLRTNLTSGLSIEDEASALYAYLIQPFESQLSEGVNKSQGQLIIIPHGVLHYLPFAALMDQQKRYLLERFCLSFVPSATVLKFCFEQGDKFQSQKQVVKKILAIGNPDLGDSRYDLPFAEKEAVSLQREFSNVEIYLKKQATETVVKEKIATADLVLFSCHAEYDPLNPLFSALLLTPDEQNDGRLESWEIFELNMNTFLVTMSACETGLGKVTQGDEVIGLPRGFIYAGTPAVVASLWKVDDLVTAITMKRFHRQLRHGVPRAVALRNAQLYVKNFVNPNPAYWAAFYLTGDFR